MSKSVLHDTCLDCLFCFEVDEGIKALCSITPDDKDTSFHKEITCKDGYCQGKPDWCPLKGILKS